MAELPPPPRELDAESAHRFREAVARAGFGKETFAVLGSAGLPGWKAAMRAALGRLPTRECGLIARFLVIGDAIAREEVASALGGATVLEAFEHAGIAVAAGDNRVQCPFVLIAAKNVMALSDAIEDPVPIEPADDYIIPISATSHCVDDLTVRVPCELAVDLGCGQGYLALRSLAHVGRCIATDINPRAVAFARANLSLAGASSRIECRVGSLFEPLADLAGQVDLFTCNPPFFIKPGAHTKASVTDGDAMLEHLVRGAPAMLREGGWATIIGIWEHASQLDWESRTRPWLEACGCDALVLRFATFSADEYFRSSTPPAARAAAEPAWKHACRTRGIGALTYGGFVLRKRSGPNWFRSITTPIGIRSGEASEQLRAYFATQTVVEAGPNPAALLDGRLRIGRGWRYDPNRPVPTAAPSGARAGMALALPSVEELDPLLEQFDGTVTARQVLGKGPLADRVGLPVEHPEAIGLIRSLLMHGFLEVADER